MKYRFLAGVDPGFANLGYTLYDSQEDKILSSGVIRTKKDQSKRAREDNADRFAYLLQEFSTVMPSEIDFLFVEGMSQPRDSRAAWKLALGWGVVLAWCYQNNIPLIQITPTDIKYGVTGSRTASKQEVIRHIRKRRKDVTWPKATTKHEHVADAVGALLVGMKDPRFGALLTGSS
jgi:crossover junction endodeoxyribonuclease RuvC